MIITLLLNFILLVFGTIFSFLPVVSIADVPIIGGTLRSLLVYIVQMWNAFLNTFPYAETAWYIFLVVILPFEILMLIAKFFLGSRSPAKHD